MSLYKLIIVDDEPSVRQGLVNLIDWKQLDIEVIGTASDGEEAFCLINTYRPHIVITDIQMPKLSGLDLIKKTLEYNIKTKFIILSGYDDFCYAQKAITYKVGSYLLKPLKASRLQQELHDIIRSINTDSRQQATQRQATLGQSARIDKFFNMLIDHSESYDTMDSTTFESLNVLLPTTDLRCCIFSISNTSDYAPSLVSFLIRNILKDIFSTIESLTFERQGEIILLLPDNAYSQEEMDTLCMQAHDVLLSYFQLEIIIGIGEQSPRLSDIHFSYQSAKHNLAYSLYDSKTKIFRTPMPHKTSISVPQISSIDTYALIDSILRIDIDAIEKETQALLEKLFYIEMPPPDYIKGMCSFIFMDVLKKIKNYPLETDVSSICHRHITMATTYTDIHSFIMLYFIQIAKTLRDQNLLVDDPVIQSIKDYVELHIDEKILLKDIAKHVHLSENYLTILFKKKTGDSFRDYVLRIKIERAKALLKATNYTINEISQQLGYSDYRSFNRVFKRFTGQTPSTYYSEFHKGKTYENN